MTRVATLALRARTLLGALLATTACCAPTLDLGANRGDGPPDDLLDAARDVAAADALDDLRADADARVPTDVALDAPSDVARDVASDNTIVPVDGAATACANLVACTVRAVSLTRCLTMLGTPLDAAGYAALYAGHATTSFVGEDNVDGGLGPGYGLVTQPGDEVLSIAQSPAVRDCLARARGCDAVLGCLSGTASATPCTPSSGPSPSTRCVGSVLRACVFASAAGGDGGALPTEIDFDCALQDNPCTRGVSTGGYATYGCAPAACAGELSQCASATSAIDCHESLLERFACPAGTACSGTPGLCRGATTLACDAMSYVDTCAAGALRQCVNQRVATTPCAAGLACEPAADAGSGAAFCGVARECDPALDAPTCDVALGVITACELGRRVTIRCRTDLGFATCANNVPTGATCTP